MSSYSFSDNGEREIILSSVKRVVVKVGTQILRARKSVSAEQRIAELVSSINLLRKRGLEVILVSSGSIGFGMSAFDLKVRPRRVDRLQALAAVGQSHLMSCYNRSCEELGFHCAQLLLTAADLHDRTRNQHVSQCINALLEQGVLPIINENDSVSVAEIKVGDNDTLAAYVATMLRADLTILLTTAEGLRYSEKDSNELKERISVVNELDENVIQMAKGTDGNQYSTGGMITKLRAAEIINQSGEAMIIASGANFNLLDEIFETKDIGTIFLPARKDRLHARQRFLAFFSEPSGTLLVDEGAEKALCEHNKSLLPGGVLGATGTFHRGDTVCIVNSKRKELARGIVNFAFDEVAKICGSKSSDLNELLGRQVENEEIVHRDFLVLTNGQNS